MADYYNSSLPSTGMRTLRRSRFSLLDLSPEQFFFFAFCFCVVGPGPLRRLGFCVTRTSPCMSRPSRKSWRVVMSHLALRVSPRQSRPLADTTLSIVCLGWVWVSSLLTREILKGIGTVGEDERGSRSLRRAKRQGVRRADDFSCDSGSSWTAVQASSSTETGRREGKKHTRVSAWRRDRSGNLDGVGVTDWREKM
jgi:hypothetical protein